MEAPSKNSALEEAIELAGGVVALARACTTFSGTEITYQRIQRWQKSGRVPHEFCVAVEKATGGRVRREQIAFGFLREKAEAAA